MGARNDHKTNWSIIQVDSGLEWKRHIDHIRAYTPRETQTNDPNLTDNASDYNVPTLQEQDTDEGSMTSNTNQQSETTTTDEGIRRYPQRERSQPDRLM